MWELCVWQRQRGVGARNEAKEIRTRKKHSSQWMLISFSFHFVPFKSFSVFNPSCRLVHVSYLSIFLIRFFFCITIHIAMFAPKKNADLADVRACEASKTQTTKVLIQFMLLVSQPIHNELLFANFFSASSGFATLIKSYFFFHLRCTFNSRFCCERWAQLNEFVYV